MFIIDTPQNKKAIELKKAEIINLINTFINEHISFLANREYFFIIDKLAIFCCDSENKIINNMLLNEIKDNSNYLKIQETMNNNLCLFIYEDIAIQNFNTLDYE